MPFAIHRTGLHDHIHKAAAGAPDDPFEKLATKAERDIARAIYTLLSGLPDTAWARELRKRIRSGDWQAVNEQLQEAPYSPEQYRTLAEAVTTALQQGSELALADLPPITAAPGTGVGIYLPPDVIPRPNIWANPAAIQFAQRYTYDLVRHLIDDPQTPTRQTLAVVISEGLQQGHNPRQVAHAVDSIMGLTPHQAKIVASFRNHLENWGAKTDPGDWGLGQPPSKAPGGAQIYPVDERGRLTDAAQNFRLRDFRQDGFLLRALEAGRQQQAHRAGKAAFLERELTDGLQRGLTPSEARKRAMAKFNAIDQKLGGAKNLSKERIDKMVEEYARKWLKHRAATIARTESIRALNAGKFLQWQQAAADGTVDGRLVMKRWLVSAGERTCPTCNGIARHYNAFNNGWGIQLEQLFDPSVLSNRAGASMEPVLYPVLHPNCFTGDTLLTAGYGLRSLSRRPYEGELVVVSTAGKVRLTVTPNHPILTRRGWIAAGQLREGDQLINQAVADRFAPKRSKLDDDHVPASFAQIHDLAAVAGIPSLIVKQPVAATDFHGDGRQGDVDIVAANRRLPTHDQAPGLEHPGKLDLFGRDIGIAASLQGLGGLFSVLIGMLRAANGIVRSCGQCEPLLGWGLAHAGVHPGASVAWGHSIPQQYGADDGPRNSVAIGQRLLTLIKRIGGDDLRFRSHNPAVSPTHLEGFGLGSVEPKINQPLVHRDAGDAVGFGGLGDGLAVNVGLDDELAEVVRVFGHDQSLGPVVSGIGRARFVGDVYNAETSTGFYAANGLIVHNCRCTVLYREVTPFMIGLAA